MGLLQAGSTGSLYPTAGRKPHLCLSHPSYVPGWVVMCCRGWMRRSEMLVTSAALRMAGCSCTSVLMKAIEDKTSLQKGKWKDFSLQIFAFPFCQGFSLLEVNGISLWDLACLQEDVSVVLPAASCTGAAAQRRMRRQLGQKQNSQKQFLNCWRPWKILSLFWLLSSPESCLITSNSLHGHCRQSLPLGLEWLVRLATVVLVRQLFMKVHMGWEGV